MEQQQIEQLVASYKPNNRVLEELKVISLVAAVGSSASGKTTIMQMAAQAAPDVHEVIGDTSRLMRAGEENGVGYFFRTKQEMISDIKLGNYVQVIMTATGELYGTRLGNYPKQGIGLMGVISSAVAFFRSLPFASFNSAFIVPADYDKWMGWFKERLLPVDEQTKRLEEAIESYKFALTDPNMRFVLNDILELAVNRFLQVAHGEEPDSEAKAKATAQANYQKLIQSARSK